MALMAELPNGTIIGIRGCRVYTMAGCNSSVVCNSENETIPQGARFKRCIGECCSDYLCNHGLYPVLAPVTPEPASSYASVMDASVMQPVQGLRPAARTARNQVLLPQLQPCWVRITGWSSQCRLCFCLQCETKPIVQSNYSISHDIFFLSSITVAQTFL